jgi:AcrR family transcriptional regulator
MLDACAELVDEVGYEGLTTTLLAERAGVAIGSVYQFFPDKRAIVQALTLRNMEAYLQRLNDRIVPGELDHWWDGVDAGIDEYIDMHRMVPGFRTLHFGDVVDLHLLDDDRDNNGVIAEQLARVLVEQFGLADTPRLRFALEIAVEAADALIRLAFRRGGEGDERVLAEARALIRDYLHRHVEDNPDQRPPADRRTTDTGPTGAEPAARSRSGTRGADADRTTGRTTGTARKRSASTGRTAPA